MATPWLRARPDEPERSTADIANRTLLISIQPRYANAILEGTKTIELRRTTPTLPPHAMALIYSSSPTKALVGWATVDSIVRAAPAKMWEQHHSRTGVTAAEFNSYFAGTDDAFGIRLSCVERASVPVSLGTMRKHGVEPPQSWRYISPSVTEQLLEAMTRASNLRAGVERRQRAFAAVG